MPIFSRLNVNLFGTRSMITANVRVEFETGIVDMVGTPCTGAGYSLPGTVIVTLPALPSGFEGRYRLLNDVTIMVEGQSEYWDATGRYTPLRLFSSTLPLVPVGKPLLIPSHDIYGKDRSARVTVALPFDLRLPGWLPPTMISTYTANFYGVVTSVEVGWSDQTLSHALPAFVPSLDETATATAQYATFIVRRHRVPTALCPTAAVRDRTFARDAYSKQLGRMLSFVVVLPEWVDIHAESLDLSLRIRVYDSDEKASADAELANRCRSQVAATDGHGRVSMATDISGPNVSFADTTVSSIVSAGTKDDSRHLAHILELGMGVEELGQFSSDPIRAYTRQYPLPPEQPSKNPDTKIYRLIGPSYRPQELMLDASTTFHGDEPNRPCLQRLCLLSDEGTQRRYQFPGNGKGLGTSWRRIRFVLPMPKVGSPGDATRPTPDSDTPFLKLRHTLNIRVVLQAPGFTESESITVAVPIRFGSAPETLPAPASHAPPPYISIFHENGDLRDCDPLPLYPGTPVTATSANTGNTAEPMVVDSIETTPAASPAPQFPAVPALSSLHDEAMDTERSEEVHDAQSSPSLSCVSSPTSSPERRVVKLPAIAQVQRLATLCVDNGRARRS